MRSGVTIIFYWYDFFLFLLMVGGGALVYGGIFVTLASLGFGRMQKFHYAAYV